MKYMRLLMGLAVLLGFGCRTVKERGEAEQRRLIVEKQGSALQWSQHDSAGRYWHFQSDSAFYYHPDEGLYGSRGWLAVEEEQVRRNRGQKNDDNSTYHINEQSESSYTAVPAPKPKIGWWSLIFGVVLLLSFLVFRKLHK